MNPPETTSQSTAAPTGAPSATDQTPPAPPIEQAPAQEPHPNAPPASSASSATPPPAPAPAPSGTAADMPATKGTPASSLRGPLPFEMRDYDDLWRYAQMIQGSRLLAEDVRGSAQSVMHLLTIGHAIGLPVHRSLAIYVIEGKPCLPAIDILSLCKASRFCKAFTLVESTLDRAVYRAVRVDPRTGEIVEDVTLDFTIEEAAPLIKRHRESRNPDKAAWITQPRAMLRWRCVTALARQVFPDVIGGIGGREEVMDALELDRAGNVQTVTVPRAEVDGAKPAGGIEYQPTSVNLAALPPPGRDMLDATFSEVTSGHGAARDDREPEPVPARTPPREQPRGTSGRLGAMADQARGRGGPPGYDGPTCTECGGPVPRKGQRCIACANQ